MPIYTFMCRIGFPKSYLGKILFISFLGVHIPMIGAVSFVLLSVDVTFTESLNILAAMLIATLIGTAATMAVLYALLAPVTEAASALHGYLDGGTVPALPTKYRDRAGILLANVQEAITRLDLSLDLTRTQRDEAVRTKKNKFDVLAGMSHDLRTPLNHVIGFAELMSNESLGPLGTKAYRSYADDIGSSGKDLLQTLQMILDLSSSEAERTEIVMGRVAVAEALHRAINLVHHRAEEQQITYELDTEIREEMAVRTDERTFKQILLHIFDIAMTDPDSTTRIYVSAGDDGTNSTIHVENDCAWRAEDIPADLQVAGSLKAYTDLAGRIDASTPTALCLSLINSLVKSVGGEFMVSTSDQGGRWLAVSLPLFEEIEESMPTNQPDQIDAYLEQEKRYGT
jgi:signal transduction histidine kinase